MSRDVHLNFKSLIIRAQFTTLFLKLLGGHDLGLHFSYSTIEIKVFHSDAHSNRFKVYRGVSAYPNGVMVSDYKKCAQVSDTM